MKIINSINSKALFSLGLILTLASGCERELSEDAILATYPTTPEVFIDGFSGGLEYLPFGGSKLDAFTVDAQTFYSGTASMRFDVPNVGDPDGAFAGAIFPDYGGRNLTGYDALTFWAKASQPGTLNEIGFGSDFGQNRHIVTQTNLRLTTNWKKYIIPIPDPSKLTRENGMFWYAEGPENGNGYSFWIDELKFEKLGTIAQPRPAIFNGADLVERSFLGAGKTISGLTQTFNLGSGLDATVNAAPAYFTFTSSNTDVATVNELGVISIIGTGSTKITATLGNVKAAGSLTLDVQGAFTLAPIPTRDPSNVISIYSDTYQNVPVDFFNGYWEPFQTTESSNFEANGNNMINYTNFNFVGNQFANPTIDITGTPNLHLNMYIPDEVPANLDFLISVVDFGGDGVEGGGDDTRQQIFFKRGDFVADTWSTLEAPITLANKSHIGLIIYENVNGSSLSSFYLDNIYFYRE